MDETSKSSNHVGFIKSKRATKTGSPVKRKRRRVKQYEGIQFVVKRSRRKRLLAISKTCQTLPPGPLINQVRKKMEQELEKLETQNAQRT